MTSAPGSPSSAAGDDDDDVENVVVVVVVVVVASVQSHPNRLGGSTVGTPEYKQLEDEVMDAYRKHGAVSASQSSLLLTP